jgi:cytochrome c
MNTSRVGTHVVRLQLFLGLILIFLLLTACTGEVNGVPEERPSSSINISNGRKLIANYGCGSCHSIPGVPGADAMVGPPLEYFYQRTFIAGRLPNTRDNLIHWIQDPQGVEPGTAMPDLGVSESEAGDIADYLYHKITINDFISQ